MKQRPIFITATNTDIGKTYATLKIIEALGLQGSRVGVLKPIETGVGKYPADGKLLLHSAQKFNPELKSFTYRDIVPVQFGLPAAPYVSRCGENIDFELITKAYEKISQASDIVLIEGAGGLMVPVEEDFYMYDFAKLFNAKILLVTHSKLGCINDTLLNLRLLESLDIEHEWCINVRDEKSFSETTLPYYRDKFGRILTLQDNLDEILSSLR
ncbi:MAG: dethiobiotin synthase [Sulfurospirillum sp.]